ncbi:MAG: putative toxin-antitoxin system toxin component, PIN family [Clostridiales Family XIII bacterium]|nr:putative toxin-antitoxin system toxin component, PIN family [Clostridiales Family XIII bacterium]
MRILTDTNILISALFYPDSRPAQALIHIAKNHTLVLTDYNLAEFRRIAETKFHATSPVIEVFLTELAYEFIIAPDLPQRLIADAKDAPILNAAIASDVDIIISGDRHFFEIDIERPKVLTVAKYLESCGVGL